MWPNRWSGSSALSGGGRALAGIVTAAYWVLGFKWPDGRTSVGLLFYQLASWCQSQTFMRTSNQSVLKTVLLGRAFCALTTRWGQISHINKCLHSPLHSKLRNLRMYERFLISFSAAVSSISAVHQHHRGLRSRRYFRLFDKENKRYHVCGSSSVKGRVILDTRACTYAVFVGKHQTKVY